MSNSTSSLLIQRQSFEKKQTLGIMMVLLGKQIMYTCKTLELPDLNNAPQKSCIPAGTYTVVKRESPKYGKHFHVTQVPNRDYILIHQGNFYSDILGCILPGKEHKDLNADGCRDVTDSKNTMKMLLSLLPNKFTLTIT